VGAAHFDVTFLDIDGGKRGFRKEQSVLQLRNSLPKLFPGLAERQQSIVIRPRAKDRLVLVQLDDLDAAGTRAGPIRCVSDVGDQPGNHQAWVAVSGVGEAKDFARRLRKGTGADPAASGAVRLAGSVNLRGNMTGLPDSINSLRYPRSHHDGRTA